MHGYVYARHTHIPITQTRILMGFVSYAGECADRRGNRRTARNGDAPIRGEDRMQRRGGGGYHDLIRGALHKEEGLERQGGTSVGVYECMGVRRVGCGCEFY